MDDDDYEDAINKGIIFVINSQLENGEWPWKTGGIEYVQTEGEALWALSIMALIPQETIQSIKDSVQTIIDENSGTPQADKLTDVINKLNDVVNELNKLPPDNQAAVGNLEGAVGDLEAAIEDGLLDPVEGTQMTDQLVGVARQLALDAIEQAIALNGDPTVIAEAQQYLADGDSLRISGSFKDAVNMFKDALAKAESVY